MVFGGELGVQGVIVEDWIAEVEDGGFGGGDAVDVVGGGGGDVFDVVKGVGGGTHVGSWGREEVWI